MKKKLFRGNLFLLLILVMLLSASCGRNRATTMKLIKTDGEVRWKEKCGGTGRSRKLEPMIRMLEKEFQQKRKKDVIYIAM